MSVAAAADSYVARGWAVLPLVHREKRPVTDHGKDDATTDPTIVHGWFSSSDYNIGAHAGRSGFVVVDIDPRNNGYAQFDALVAEIGELPRTITADTGSGGVHYLFATPRYDEMRFDLRAKLRKGIDLIRGNNYIVVAPSIHPCGGMYRWRDGLAPDQVELAHLPLAWLDLALRERPKAERSQPGAAPTGDSIYDALAQLNQKYVLECVSGTWLVDGEVFTFKKNSNGKYNLIVDGKERGNFIDTDGRIGAPNANGKDGGPLASTWLRWYQHDDVEIRRGLIDLVPELARFGESKRKTTDREPPPDRESRASDGDTPHVADPPTPAKPVYQRLAEFDDEIEEHKDDAWVELAVGGSGTDRITDIALGNMAIVIGGSGSGKSSLVSTVLVNHARHHGPAIALSIELPGRELAARIVGIRCDTSWKDVLRGKLERLHIRGALDIPRMYIIARRAATLPNLLKTIADVRRMHPGEPILVAVDYAQLIDSREREARLRVADALERLDDIAREQLVAMICVSQMSRASAKIARKGEAIGADSADLGAESAAIERFAAVTLTIGMANKREDGSSAVELSIGKERMEGGADSVVPMTFWGKSGLWQIAGEAQTAAEVREKRDVEKEQKQRSTIEHAIVGLAMAAAAPVTRQQLIDGVSGRKATKVSAVSMLLARGDLIEVDRRQVKSKYFLVWTPQRAQAAGIAPRQQGVE